MSPTMILGRVVLPLAGLAVACALAWSFVGGRIKLPPGLAALASDAAEEPTPSPADGPAAAARIVAEGRVVTYPGAQVTIGAEVTGTIVKVPVAEKSAVRRGDVLVEFRADELRAQLAEANARLAEAEAEVARLELEHQRASALLGQKASTRQEYDRTRFNLLAHRARRDAMAAARDRLEAQVARYRVVAAIGGVITARMANPGETVAASTPLVTIADLKRLRIEAEVDEYDIASCRVGQRVKVTAEGYPGRAWAGEVEEVADVLIGRRIRPEDPGKPTDTRVLPVRIALREATPLRLGQRVEVEIDRGDAEPRESRLSPVPDGATTATGASAPGAAAGRP